MVRLYGWGTDIINQLNVVTSAAIQQFPPALMAA